MDLSTNKKQRLTQPGQIRLPVSRNPANLALRILRYDKKPKSVKSRKIMGASSVRQNGRIIERSFYILA